MHPQDLQCIQASNSLKQPLKYYTHYHQYVPHSYFQAAAVEREGTGARMSWKTDTQIEVWYWKPTNEERYVERQDRLGIFPLKDGVPWVLVTQGAASSEINKGCILRPSVWLATDQSRISIKKKTLM